MAAKEEEWRAVKATMAACDQAKDVQLAQTWDDLRRMQAVHAADTRLWEVERSALVKSQSAAAAFGGNQSDRPTTLGSGQSAAVAVDEGQLERSAR
uniref:Uncharacterized protein n=1 Tax=Mantoniella antarctica TaxID=81844 RepID=A0A7S0SMA7_9CHLO